MLYCEFYLLQLLLRVLQWRENPGAFFFFICCADSWWYGRNKLKMNAYENKSEIGLGIPCITRDKVAVFKHNSHDRSIRFLGYVAFPLKIWSCCSKVFKRIAKIPLHFQDKTNDRVLFSIKLLAHNSPEITISSNLIGQN